MRAAFILIALATLSLVASGAGATTEPRPIQPLIDATPANGTLTLDPGLYAGPAVITRPMKIDGGGGAIIDNGGVGTVVLLATDGAVVQNLTLRNSGHLHNDIDSGVQVRGRFNVIKNNVIENCLFGVDLQQSNNNIVRNNHITSKDIDQGMRGDAVRLWYSTDNRIEGNTIEDSRDFVVWYSKDNVIANNVIVRGRYGLHFMYSHYNLVEGNDFYGSTVGIFLMYSDSVVVRDNHVERSHGASGIGIGFKETSGAKIVNNDILGNAVGIYFDVSPYDPDLPNLIEGNRIAYNGMAVLFHTDWSGNTFRANDFVSNFSQVAVRGNGSALRHQWQGNHWDAYEGFDRDADGVGDTPFTYYGYADRLWMDVPPAEFFRGSVVLELIDFMERLLPFTEPKLLVKDARPLVNRIAGDTFAPKTKGLH